MVGAETKSSKERQKERKNSLEISGYSGLHHQRNVWTNLDGILLLAHPTFKDLPTLSHSLLPPCHLITCTQPFPARHSSIQPGLRYLSNCCVAAPPGQFHHCGHVFTSSAHLGWNCLHNTVTVLHSSWGSSGLGAK